VQTVDAAPPARRDPLIGARAVAATDSLLHRGLLAKIHPPKLAGDGSRQWRLQWMRVPKIKHAGSAAQGGCDQCSHYRRPDGTARRLSCSIARKAFVAGIVMHRYASMEEAWPAIGCNPPAVTLVDIALPGMSGIEGGRILRDLPCLAARESAPLCAFEDPPKFADCFPIASWLTVEEVHSEGIQTLR